MFGSKPQIDIDMIVPTSKIALKTSCIRACGGDIAKAAELYEFYAKDLQSLPDFEAVRPSSIEQARSIVGGAFSWIDNNQDKIINYYNLFQAIRGGQPLPTGSIGVPPVDVPPIPTE